MTKPMYRQGDVLLVKMSRQVPMFAGVDAADTRLVLAHGEKSGHTHAVAAADAMLETTAVDGEPQVHLLVRRATLLTHQEHAPIQLEPGEYRVVIQRQYDPAENRTVSD